MIHEDDESGIAAVSQGIGDKGNFSQAVRTSIDRLLEIIYERGRLRGYQEALEVDKQVQILRGQK